MKRVSETYETPPTKCTSIHVMGVRKEEKEHYSKKNG